jgi:hypothetical protein
MKERELKPGDLFVMTEWPAKIDRPNLGDVLTYFGEPGRPEMKLVCIHACGALEFLVLPPKDAQ